MSLLNRAVHGGMAAVALLLGQAAGAQSQASFTVSGTVEELPSRTPVVGATVSIDGRFAMLTDERGRFRFNGVTAGPVELTVHALGYVDRVVRVPLRADTTLTIELNVDPVLLQALRADARLVSVRGELRERGSSTPITHARVFATQNRNATAALDGWFQFKRVPAGVPFEIHIMAFSYEPMRISFTPQQDTTLKLELDVDTMMHRMIGQQLTRLETRMVDAIGKGYAIPRSELLRYRGEPLTRALQWIMWRAPLALRSAVRCTFVDEREVPNDAAVYLFPEEVERVEYLYHGAMLRIYTRRFMAQLASHDMGLGQTGFSEVPLGLIRSEAPHAFCS